MASPPSPSAPPFPPNGVTLANLQNGQALDAFYLLVCGVFVFFMQCGFALLEAGTVRSKNTKNILLKNLLDACIGAIIWWAWGFGVAYGDSGNSDGNTFIGTAPNNGGPFLAVGWAGEDSQNNGTTMTLWQAPPPPPLAQPLRARPAARLPCAHPTLDSPPLPPAQVLPVSPPCAPPPQPPPRRATPHQHRSGGP